MRSMFQRLFTGCVFLAATFTVQAEPVVAGNLITIDNTFSWFQVQRADDYSTVCEGSEPCIVEAGVYNVIDLTFAERFENISITSNNEQRLLELVGLDVNVEVYSTTAMEVFWERSTFVGVRYEVYNLNIDRESPQIVTDGGSFYADNLQPGKFYAWRVVAVTDADERIELGRLLAQTNIPFMEPQPPTDVTEAVYSATAAELFWSRARGTQFTGIVRRNEIRRDSELIATLQGENLRSFYDDTREPNTPYFYEITAVYNNGFRRSTGFQSAAWVDPTATDESDGELPADLQRVIDQVTTVLSGELMIELNSLAQSVLARVQEELPLLSRTVRDDGIVTLQYDCGDDKIFNIEGIGADTLDHNQGLAAGIRPPGTCAVGTDVVGGFYSWRREFPRDIETGTDLRFSAQEASIMNTADGASIQLGNGRIWAGSNDRDRRLRSLLYRDLDWGKGELSLSISNLYLGSIGLTVTEEYEINGSGISNPELPSATYLSLIPFTGFSDGLPSMGELLVTLAGEGSVRINVDSGDAEMFLATRRLDGVSTSYLVPWPEGFAF